MTLVFDSFVIDCQVSFKTKFYLHVPLVPTGEKKTYFTNTFIPYLSKNIGSFQFHSFYEKNLSKFKSYCICFSCDIPTTKLGTYYLHVFGSMIFRIFHLHSIFKFDKSYFG